MAANGIEMERKGPAFETNVPGVYCAGDAHRAGLIKGLVHGLAMPDAARLGSVSASFALEKLGTQEHVFTPADFCQRYEAVFGPVPKGIFAV